MSSVTPVLVHLDMSLMHFKETSVNVHGEFRIVTTVHAIWRTMLRVGAVLETLSLEV